MKKILSQLMHYRVKANLSRQELADKIGVDEYLVKAIETRPLDSPCWITPLWLKSSRRLARWVRRVRRKERIKQIKEWYSIYL